jgi:hypothetical protein
MAKFTDTVMIKDRPHDRAVKVTIEAPDVSKFKPSSPEVEALAQKAYRAVNHTITIGSMKVTAKAFGR